MDNNSKVNVKIFEGKRYFICGEQGCEKVADCIPDWFGDRRIKTIFSS